MPKLVGTSDLADHPKESRLLRQLTADIFGDNALIAYLRLTFDMAKALEGLEPTISVSQIERSYH